MNIPTNTGREGAAALSGTAWELRDFLKTAGTGVDFLGTQPFVDRERIGAIEVCGSGSFVISAAKIDPRIKAISTLSMYDMGAAEPKELYFVPGAGHVDLYDRVNLIPWGKLNAFFTRHLA